MAAWTLADAARARKAREWKPTPTTTATPLPVEPMVTTAPPPPPLEVLNPEDFLNLNLEAVRLGDKRFLFTSAELGDVFLLVPDGCPRRPFDPVTYTVDEALKLYHAATEEDARMIHEAKKMLPGARVVSAEYGPPPGETKKEPA